VIQQMRKNKTAVTLGYPIKAERQLCSADWPGRAWISTAGQDYFGLLG
jgi:hypothetical protein